ncbi:DNA alkylation repair protein [Fulvivirgaceae bacterium BMA12]|uniref:DNA alkylation repair protein n=1 Tax=Agaribacillus aureus TaxID=3051825 RepID=A0ABT8LBF3_9BACT|nr:DNA alkylation repair protein [Fulvivirgaceae bacterium BMA12]
MNLTSKAQEIRSQITKEGTKLGDLRKIAKEIKKDHALALELWSIGEFLSRQLAILIMDKKLFTQEFIDQLDRDMQNHEYEERTHLADWLMANQLARDKKTIGLIESWEHSPSVMQRRIFWYYQARLRWTGQTPPGNTEDLLSSLEKKMVMAEPEVQWAMNFTAGWIGIFDPAYRSRCVALGEKTGLYKDEVVPKGCTPNYLPEFIKIEVNKRNK